MAAPGGAAALCESGETAICRHRLARKLRCSQLAEQSVCGWQLRENSPAAAAEN